MKNIINKHKKRTNVLAVQIDEPAICGICIWDNKFDADTFIGNIIVL